ncbi:hypothetical protein ACQ4XT_19100 [Halobacillus faecis]
MNTNTRAETSPAPEDNTFTTIDTVIDEKKAARIPVNNFMVHSTPVQTFISQAIFIHNVTQSMIGF